MSRARRSGALLALGGALALASSASAGPYTEAGYAPGLMAAWASSVDELVRGPVDDASPPNHASHGSAANALGPTTSDTFHVVSLGDGGHITLHFASGIGDGPGDDLAVYENAFPTPGGQQLFVELAFVEVSSDGVAFARFAATSLQPDPVGETEGVDPTDYHNLAGKHPLGSGTGFDLAELAGHPLVTAGRLDLDAVHYVRLVDVIGDGSTQDRHGEPVYDPYPTPYPTGGFDADAVGVLHVAPEPEALALGASGTLLLLVLRRRRQARACAAAR